MTTIQTSPSLGSPKAIHNPLWATEDNDARLAQFLDKAIPLKEGASHADVVAYGVDTPFWHTECYAITQAGEKIGFADKHRFLGWSGRNPIVSLLFEYDDVQLELKLRADRAAPRPVADINLLQANEPRRFNQTSYIGITGAPI